ncbi:MAG: DUF1134 domain-containing protein [Proteobacteria bacterium]|nr:DUF1134 domain-containing protein [Pseudomonadota bacterium]
MSEDLSKSRRVVALGLGAAVAGSLIPTAARAADSDRDTYSEPEIVRAAEDFFGAAAEGLANVIHHIFNEKGRPNGYITGDEGSGAIGVGLRYGGGRLHLKGLSSVTPVYWQGPSIGFDTGGNASKVFTLVYHMHDPERIFQRFPGVDGSAYFVGGFGANYQQSGRIILAPIRAGVGFRLGANIGYLNYSRHRRVLPF